jgi:hypothetical protein
VENIDELLAKQQSDQQRIDQDGVRIFQSQLPSTDKLSVTFNEQGSNDFGIDGEIQILINRRITGEKYKVQIKSSEHIKYIQGGKKVSFSLDIRSAHSLVKIEKVPTALIVVDTVKKKVFWLAIQIDKTVESSLAKKLSKTNKEILKDQSVTVHIDTQQQLTSDTFTSMHNELKTSSVQLAKNNVVSTKEKSLMTGIKNLQAIEQRILELEGFIPHIRNQSDTPANKTVMSISHGASKSIDYVPGPDFRPDLAPVIQVKASFHMKHEEDKKLADTLKSVLSGKTGSITLPSKNIELFTATSGTTLIDSLEKDGDLMITVSKNIEKRNQTLILRSKDEELQVQTQSWVSDNVIHVESIESEPIHITMSIPIPPLGVVPSKGIEMKAKISMRGESFINASHELRIMNFVKNANDLEMYFLGPDGFRNKFMDAGKLSEALKISDDFYDLILKLTEIEAKAGHQIKYPRPEELTGSDATTIRKTHALLYGKDKLDQANLNLVLNDKDAALPGIDDVIGVYENPASFTVFGHTYKMPGYEKRITGTISKIEQSATNDMSYDLQINDVVAQIVPSNLIR